MTRNVSSAFKAAAFSESTHEVFVMLLTITHPSFTDDIRVCNDPTVLLPTAGVRGIVSNGDEFIFVPFEVSLPAQNDSGVAEAQIKVDNVGEELMGPIRSAGSSIGVTIQVVLASSPDTIEMHCDNFELQSVDYDALTVSGKLTMEYYDLEPFPSGRFTPSTAPGCF